MFLERRFRRKRKRVRGSYSVVTAVKAVLNLRNRKILREYVIIEAQVREVEAGCMSEEGWTSRRGDRAMQWVIRSEVNGWDEAHRAELWVISCRSEHALQFLQSTTRPAGLRSG